MVFKNKYTALIFLVLSTLLALVAITGCDNAQSRAKRIVSLRSDRKQMLDKLYQQYGGSELSQSIKSGLQNEKGAGNSPENQFAQGVANLAQGADRSIFEQSIRTVGSGENMVTITDKAKQFYSRPDVIKQSKKIYQIEVELEQLENNKGN